MMRLLALVTFATICLQHATGQQPVRGPGFGRATTADGAPWSDAVVHLHYRPHPRVGDPAYGEHLVVACDERGQFRADLLVGVRYDAWAIGPIAEDGSYRISKLVHNAVARTPILLPDHREQFVRRVRVVLPPSWNGKETLRYRASLEGSSRVPIATWLQPDADGVLTLPRWPDTFVLLQAWTDDWLAWRTGVYVEPNRAVSYGLQFRSENPKPTKENVRELLAQVQPLELPPRRTRDVTLRCADAPVAGARVLHDQMPHDLQGQRSDADGVVHTVFAHAEEQPFRVPYRWTILPTEHAEQSLSPGSQRDGQPPVRSVEMIPGRTLQTTVTLGGEPLVHAPILLDGSVRSSDTSTWFGIDARVLRTDERGRLQVPGRIDKFPFRLAAVLTPAQRTELAGDDGAPVAPLAILHWGTARTPAKLGPFSLDALRPIDVQVRQPDGTPPGSTKVVCTRVGIGDDAPSEPIVTWTDHRGRVRLLAHERDDVLVHAITPRGAAWMRLEPEQQRAVLDIDERHIARFRIVDRNGAPLPNVRLHLVAASLHAGGDQEVAAAIRDLCTVNAFERNGARADQDGVVTMISPLLGSSLDCAVYVRGESKSRRGFLIWSGPSERLPELRVR